MSNRPGARLCKLRTPASGLLTVAPGQRTLAFTVPVLDDSFDEDDETVLLSLSNPSDATLGSPITAVLIISDDDAPPTVQFSSSEYATSENVVSALITATLSIASGKTVSVHYATANGTATAGSDYATTTGTLTFAPGETIRAFIVPIVNDTTDEDDETVALSLDNPINATLGTPVNATLTITDNDPPPAVRFAESYHSANESVGDAPIAVVLSHASTKTVTVEYGSADGTAAAGNDYTLATGTLTFAPGQLTVLFYLPVLNDSLDEYDETVLLSLSNPSSTATLGSPANAVFWIVDDDPPPTVQLSSSAYSGGEADGSVLVTATLSAVSSKTVTVNHYTYDGTAQAPGDYTTAWGTLTFAPGELTQTFSVPIVNDTTDEDDETVLLAVYYPSNAVLGTPFTATLTILDDDLPPTVQLVASDYSADEGDGSALVTVTLSAVSGKTVTVQYATADGTATATQDYSAATGMLTFYPGQTTLSFSVPIIQDINDEFDETVALSLSNPGNATLGTPPTATLLIVDDDPLVMFSEPEYVVYEDAGIAIITVQVVTVHGSGSQSHGCCIEFSPR